jgi:hypothetical protein
MTVQPFAPDATPPTDEELAEPVCRECGSDEALHSIEHSTEWRYVTWERDEDGTWNTGDESSWDRVGDDVSTTVGTACGECYAESYAIPRLDITGTIILPPDPSLIITRAEYLATAAR